MAFCLDFVYNGYKTADRAAGQIQATKGGDRWGLPVRETMKIQTIVDLLEAEVLCGGDRLESEVHSACGSDMMSDVLAYVKEQAVLLTGLVNPQVIRTAMMMDMRCIVFVRGKNPSDEMIALANEGGIVLLSTEERMYVACGKLYASGLAGEGEDE